MITQNCYIITYWRGTSDAPESFSSYRIVEYDTDGRFGHCFVSRAKYLTRGIGKGMVPKIYRIGNKQGELIRKQCNGFHIGAIYTFGCVSMRPFLCTGVVSSKLAQPLTQRKKIKLRAFVEQSSICYRKHKRSGKLVSLPGRNQKNVFRGERGPLPPYFGTIIFNQPETGVGV